MPNRLIHEKSPYLRQHAYNPVDWHPWCDEAFQLAEKQAKPIFLSIGYSSCHWCHVMSRESFEDQTVADLMNDAFICIKVDREERPDIDQVYMAFCQMMTGRGGWPLSIIMTWDKSPFFAATYIPKRGDFGQIGMLELIPWVRNLWTNKRAELLNDADKITIALKQSQSARQITSELGQSTLDNAYSYLVNEFDHKNGGFGSSPKFPTPLNLLFLLRYWHRMGETNALEMVKITLKALRQGGIYDQIGFGFHRYSTDPEWFVPHFEKMLYDQALLIFAYVEAYQATADEEFATIAKEVIEYILRDMRSSKGGFYSAEDADSEGEEGRFYLWTAEELKSILTNEEYGLFFRIFDVRQSGNFNRGKNILRMLSSMEDATTITGHELNNLRYSIENIRKKLFEYRSLKVHPFKDDKILADWNGLMIAALAKAMQIFDEPEIAGAACRAADFILEQMRDQNGRLFHRYRDGVGIISNLDDYAFLIWGLIELYETIFDLRYLIAALDLNKIMLDQFWDIDHSGLFFSPNDGEALIVRQKEIFDGALPSGNSVAMYNLLRLYHITGDPELNERAAAIAKAFSGSISMRPFGYMMFMCALDFALGPACEVAIIGDQENPDTIGMLNALKKEFLPNKIVILVDRGQVQQIAKFTEGLAKLKGRSTAYVCIGHTCKLPTYEPSELLEYCKECR